MYVLRSVLRSTHSRLIFVHSFSKQLVLQTVLSRLRWYVCSAVIEGKFCHTGVHQQTCLSYVSVGVFRL